MSAPPAYVAHPSRTTIFAAPTEHGGWRRTTGQPDGVGIVEPSLAYPNRRADEPVQRHATARVLCSTFLSLSTRKIATTIRNHGRRGRLGSRRLAEHGERQSVPQSRRGELPTLTSYTQHACRSTAKPASSRQAETVDRTTLPPTSILQVLQADRVTQAEKRGLHPEDPGGWSRAF